MKIGKLEHYERIWAQTGSIKDSHEDIKKHELSANVPSYPSWKRHIANHVRTAIQAESSDWVRKVVRERERKSATLIDEINTNLTTCRGMTSTIINLMNDSLDRIQNREASAEEIRNITQLNNSITKQISEIRQTLQFVHKLRGEFEVDDKDEKMKQSKFSEIMDKHLDEEVLVKMRKELKEAGLSEY